MSSTMRIAVIGRTEILYGIAERLHASGHIITCILTAKEAPEYTRTAEDFGALAEQWSIPFARGGRIIEHISFLRQFPADIAVSINYTGVVPQEVIDLYPLGILNAHGGDLPRYRGNACQAWAILNGEKQIGLCVHKMIGGELDSGDIIARDYLSIDPTVKVTRIWDWMASRTPELMMEAIEKLAIDPGYILERQSKDPKDALRCYPRRPEDGRINWDKSALDVLRLINASNKPYAGAFCEYEGEKLIIWDAELVDDDEIFCAIPGQVTKIGKGYLEVACAEGKLRLLSIEFRSLVSTPDTIIQSIRKRLL
jgi:UDP-4-amino-4-deoxy-L-arabinose formyltransferase/UDP-glucuronic acid dehydrogenase (UDP-4-keto-hexauronic acid decarboxylating)